MSPNTRLGRHVLVGFMVANLLHAIPSTLFAAPPPQATAKPVGLASSLTGNALSNYEAGRVLLNDGDFGGARIKFQAAYDESKDPRLLWNLAACEKSSRHYANAITLVRRFVAEGGALVTDEERKNAADLIKMFESFTIALTIEVNEPNAEIELDGVVIGRAPLKSSVTVDMGEHQIRAHKEGFADDSTKLTLGSTMQQTVTLKLDADQGVVRIDAPLFTKVLVDGKELPAREVDPQRVHRQRRDVSELRLRTGPHTVEVKSVGMRDFREIVTVTRSNTHVVTATMEFVEAKPPATESMAAETPPGCGCEVPGTSALPPYALFGLSALFLRRRKSRRVR